MDDSLKMLIVDDTPIERILLEKNFADKYEVHGVSSGEDAMDFLANNPNTDIVILDVRMPGMSGFDVLREIRKDRELRRIPVILNTADNDNFYEMVALESGADDFISKPYNFGIITRRADNLVKRAQLERQLARTANDAVRNAFEKDTLTALYNREKFCDVAEELMNSHPDRRYAVVRCDVANFKVINEFYGFERGNQLIRDISRWVSLIAGDSGACSRLESDHFAFCLPADELDPEKIISRFDTEFKKRGYPHSVQEYLGIVYADDRNVSVNSLCDRANIALRTVKGSYISRFAEYDTTMREREMRELQIARDMDMALAEGQFCVYYQPIFSATAEVPISAEALVRWMHPDFGMISPGDFIPVFEKNGFIRKLDLYVLGKVCEQMRAALDTDRYVVPVSVNISRIDIYDPDIADKIEEVVSRYGLDRSYIKIEITESAFTDNARQLTETVNKLRADGFVVLMDDFGSGYSSLNALKEIKVDILKIDMKFMNELGTSSRAGSIVASVIRMAKWLDMTVVAEGVETLDQLEFLRFSGCDSIQGYYFSRPLSHEEFEKLMAGMNGNSCGTVSEADSESEADINPMFRDMTSAAGICRVTDGSVELIRANKAYYEYAGESFSVLCADVTGEVSLIYAEDRKLVSDEFRAVVNTKAPRAFTVRVLDKRGGMVSVSIRARYLGMNDGKPLVYAGVTDVRHI